MAGDLGALASVAESDRIGKRRWQVSTAGVYLRKAPGEHRVKALKRSKGGWQGAFAGRAGDRQLSLPEVRIKIGRRSLTTAMCSSPTEDCRAGGVP